MSYRRPLLRALALGSLGPALFYSNNVTNSRTSAYVSVPAPFLDSSSWPWRALTELAPTFVFSNHGFQPGLAPLSLSVPDNHTSSVAETEASEGGVDGSGHVTGINPGASRDAGSPKCPCNCLGRDTIANAAAKVGPAVVHISVPKVFYGSIGSGTIIGADGTILTCAHFVADSRGLGTLSKGQVDVTLQDGRMYKGTVAHADLVSDIAIVKITSKTPLPTANLGCSSKLRPGDWVAALGCPLTLQNTVTAGIVSCVDRKSSDLGLGGFRREYLQTDCPINEGNSGGPLINMDGELIGVNVMKVQGAQGVSFAVPVDAVSKIIEHFKTNGRVVRPWLGLKMIDLNEMIAARIKEKNAAFSYMTKGVLVPMVTPGSPAERAGFLPGDVVIEFDGKRIGSIKEIVDILGDRVGKPLKAVVVRAKGETVTLTVVPEEASPDM